MPLAPMARRTARPPPTIEVNLRGLMLLKHAVPLLLQSDGGRVVNVSSGAGARVGRSERFPATNSG